VLNRMRGLAVSPRFWLVFHSAGVVHWVVLFIPGMIFWPNSVPFLMYVSLMTALMTSVAGFGGALAARKADPEDPL
jgi:hypothetical protein